MSNNPKTTVVRSAYNDEGANFPDINDDDVAVEIIKNSTTGDHRVFFYAFNGDAPSDHSSVVSGEVVKVPLGSMWYSLGSNATNVIYKKTATSTWTKLSAV